MKILCLYSNDCAEELWSWLESNGHEVARKKERLEEYWCKEQNFDLSISYTYPYILKENIITSLNNNVVNLHTSYLPYNRGSFPNVWSILEGTPRGVTLHYIDVGLDSGDIISQVLVPLEEGATLQTSYDQLDKAGKKLFMDCFACYQFWQDMRKKAVGIGTFHRDRDLEKIRNTIENWDWNIKIDELVERMGTFNE